MDETTQKAREEFEMARSDGVKGVKLLELALSSSWPMNMIQYVCAYQFPERLDDDYGTPDPHGAAEDGWIEVLRSAKWTDEQIRNMLLGVLDIRDANMDDFGNYKARDIVVLGSGWRLLGSSASYVELIERKLVKQLPEAVLRFNNSIAYAIGVLCGEKEYIPFGMGPYLRESEESEARCTAKGKPEALMLARVACRHLRFEPSCGAEVETILELPFDVQLKIANQIAYMAHSDRASWRVPPLNRQSLRFFVDLAMNGAHLTGRDGECVERLIRETIAWESKAEKKDPWHPVRVARWVLQFMNEAEKRPRSDEEWTRRTRSTPESLRGNATPRLKYEVIEHALNECGFHIVRAELTRNPHTNREQLEATLQLRNTVLVFIHNTEGRRGDLVQDGDWVIVPERMEGPTLFRNGSTSGYLTELHPTKPPTSAMKEPVKNTMGF